MGWDSDTNTWEPVEHLAEDCKEKLEDFERRWKKRQERKEEKRMEEKKRRKEERRQKELKAAARLVVLSCYPSPFTFLAGSL